MHTVLEFIMTGFYSLYYSAAVQHQDSSTESLLHLVGNGVAPNASVGVRFRGLEVHRHEVGGGGHMEPMARVVEQAIDSGGQEAVEPGENLLHLHQPQVHKHKHLIDM